VVETFGLPYQPRMVIWQWYGNDFNEDYGLTHPEEAPALSFRTPKRHLPPLILWLKQVSMVAAILDRTASDQETARANPEYVAPYRVTDGALQFSYGLPMTIRAFNLDDPATQAGVGLTTQSLLDTRDLLAERHVPLVIILIPSKEEVYRPWTEPTLGRDTLDKWSAGRTKMIDLCRRENLLCLDVTDALSQHALRQERVYWASDLHLNAAGNQIVVDTLWQFLIDHQLATP
jgi:hypothetical protein